MKQCTLHVVSEAKQQLVVMGQEIHRIGLGLLLLFFCFPSAQRRTREWDGLGDRFAKVCPCRACRRACFLYQLQTWSSVGVGCSGCFSNTGHPRKLTSVLLYRRVSQAAIVVISGTGKNHGGCLWQQLHSGNKKHSTSYKPHAQASP